MAVLVVAAHDGKTVRSNVANAVTAASQMGPEVHVLVAGSNAGEAAKRAGDKQRALALWQRGAALKADAKLTQEITAALTQP